MKSKIKKKIKKPFLNLIIISNDDIDKFEEKQLKKKIELVEKGFYD